MRFESGLAIAAALALGIPAEAAPDGLLWIELCDGEHPGRRIPLPIDGDRERPPACHAGSPALPARRGLRTL